LKTAVYEKIKNQICAIAEQDHSMAIKWRKQEMLEKKAT
jgi:hypothetical protein